MTWGGECHRWLIGGIHASKETTTEVLLSNDGGDNHLAVGVGPANSGVVYFYLHDAPLDRNLYVIDESFEHFLGALHRETPT